MFWYDCRYNERNDHCTVMILAWSIVMIEDQGMAVV